MHLKLLFEELDGANANTRLFLIRYLHCYGTAYLHIKTIVDLTKDLGIHSNGVRAALGFLVDKNYLQKARAPSMKKGRTKMVLRIGENLMHVIEESKVKIEELHHARLINNLLEESHAWVDVDGRKKAIGLKNSERILLAVLYAHADTLGIVTGIGFSKLTELTGLNKTQLRAHIAALISHKFVLSYTSGKMARGVNARQASMFCLDCKHSVLHSSQYIVFAADVISELRVSILLAQALMVLKGSTMGEIGMSEKKFFLSIYPIRQAFFDRLVSCVDFLWGIDGVRGPKFNRLGNVICALVADLIIEREPQRSAQKKFIWLAQHKIIEEYIGRRSVEVQRVIVDFLSAVVSALYDETVCYLKEHNLKASEIAQFSMVYTGEIDVRICVAVNADMHNGE